MKGARQPPLTGERKVRAGHMGIILRSERSKTVTRAVKLDDRSFLDILKHKMYDAVRGRGRSRRGRSRGWKRQSTL